MNTVVQRINIRSKHIVALSRRDALHRQRQRDRGALSMRLVPFPFQYGRLSLRSTTPAMRRQDRIAINRRLILRSRNYPDAGRC